MCVHIVYGLYSQEYHHPTLRFALLQAACFRSNRPIYSAAVSIKHVQKNLSLSNSSM